MAPEVMHRAQLCAGRGGARTAETVRAVTWQPPTGQRAGHAEEPTVQLASSRSIFRRPKAPTSAMVSSTASWVSSQVSQTCS